MRNKSTSVASKKPSRARFLYGGLLVVGLVVAPGPALAKSPLQDLVARVCTGGIDASVARARHAQGEAAVKAADVLPNPSLVLEHQETLSGPAESETIVGLSLPLGLSGERGLQQSAARARRTQAHAAASATVFESALSFLDAYVDATAARAEARVLAEQQRRLDELSKLLQGLAKGGETGGYDLLRQRTQAQLHQQGLDTALARAQRSQALLTLWLGVEVPVPNDFEELAKAAAESLPALSGAAPEVRALEAQAQAASFEARAARRRWVPELDVFAGYRKLSAGDASGHGIAFRLGVPLTFFDHGQADTARAEAEHSLARASAANLRLRHQFEVKASRDFLASQLARVAGAAKLTAEAAALQQTAQRLYAAGEASITELIEAFRSAEEAQLAELVLLTEIAKTRVALMRAAATFFDPALDRSCGVLQRGSKP